MRADTSALQRVVNRLGLPIMAKLNQVLAMRTTRTIFMVLLLTGHGLACAGLEEGAAAYRQADYATAAREFRALADEGNADAQNELARLYRKGQGVPQDYTEAVHLYNMAAQQGNSTAQNNLGMMYRKGLGVRQDDTTARMWFSYAAKQGNNSAKYNIGVMYKNGLGVPQDYTEAVKWYRMAAEQGVAKAQNSLGVMYHEGLGVPQDNVQAYQWLYIANANGYESDAEYRNVVASKMTPGQLIKAKKLAGEWMEWQP